MLCRKVIGLSVRVSEAHRQLEHIKGALVRSRAGRKPAYIARRYLSCYTIRGLFTLIHSARRSPGCSSDAHALFRRNRDLMRDRALCMANSHACSCTRHGKRNTSSTRERPLPPTKTQYILPDMPSSMTLSPPISPDTTKALLHFARALCPPFGFCFVLPYTVLLVYSSFDML